MEEAKVTEIIAEHFGIPVTEIQVSMELRKDLNATDLEVADFFQVLEKTFGLTISKDDALALKTVSDITSYIDDHAEELA